MKYLSPTKRVALLCINSNELTLEKLLTECIAPGLVWLRSGLSVGDVGIHPAEPLLDQYIDYPDYFDHYDLDTVQDDGLENLQKIGGDGDGHEYVVGTRTGKFFAMWHGEMEFDPIATSAKDFIQWLVLERSDHLSGCPWEPFSTESASIKTVWHIDVVDMDPIRTTTEGLLEWDRAYKSNEGFQFFSNQHKLDIRYLQEHRGHNSHVRILAPQLPPQVDSYIDWLSQQGFGRHGSLM